MTPDLTVVICAFNAERYIERTLEGLFAQTCRTFRLLVVDDCSTDRTVDIVERFIRARRWEDCNVVSMPRNVGVTACRKFAEQNVDTELVLYFDADDIPRPDMIEKLSGVLRRDAECMGVGCHCDYIDENDRRIGGGFYIGPRSKREFIERASAAKLMFLHHPMFRLPLARAVGGWAVEGFPEGPIRYQDKCEDLDLWTRMSDLYAEGKYFVVIPEALFLYRKHTGANSASTRPMNERMRHIKANVKRRRAGLSDLDFVDYLASLGAWRRLRNAVYDASGDCYKRAGFHYLAGNYIRFLVNLGCSAILSPTYVFQKFSANVSLSRKSS